jgi:hypothetical protein
MKRDTIFSLLREERDVQDQYKRDCEDLNNRKLELALRSKVICERCGKSSLLRLYVLKLRMFSDFYENTMSPGSREYHSLICSKCTKANYIYTHPDKDKILVLMSFGNWDSSNIFAKIQS